MSISTPSGLLSSASSVGLTQAVGANAFSQHVDGLTPVSDQSRREWEMLIAAQLEMAELYQQQQPSQVPIMVPCGNGVLPVRSQGQYTIPAHYALNVEGRCYDIRELGHRYESLSVSIPQTPSTASLVSVINQRVQIALGDILTTPAAQDEFLRRWSVQNPHLGIERMPSLDSASTGILIKPYMTSKDMQQSWILDPAGQMLSLLYADRLVPSLSQQQQQPSSVLNLIGHNAGAIWMSPYYVRKWIEEPSVRHMAQWIRAVTQIPSLQFAGEMVSQWTLGFGSLERAPAAAVSSYDVDFYETPTAPRAFYRLTGVDAEKTQPVQPFVAVRVSSTDPANPRVAYMSLYVQEGVNDSITAPNEAIVSFPMWRALGQPSEQQAWKIEPIILPLVVKIVLKPLSLRTLPQGVPIQQFFQTQLSKYRVLQSGQFIALQLPDDDASDLLPYEVAELWALVRCAGESDSATVLSAGLVYDIGLVAAANVTTGDVIVDFVEASSSTSASLPATGRAAVIDALNRAAMQGLVTVPDRQNRDHAIQQLWMDAIRLGILPWRVFAARPRYRPPPEDDITTPTFSSSDRIMLNATPITENEIREMLTLILRGADPRLSVDREWIQTLFGATSLKNPLRASRMGGLGGLHIIPWRNYSKRPRPNPGADDMIFRYETDTCRWIPKNIKGVDLIAVSPRSSQELLRLMQDPDYIYFVVDHNNNLVNPILFPSPEPAKLVVARPITAFVASPLPTGETPTPPPAVVSGVTTGGASVIPGTTDERIMDAAIFLNIPEAQVRQVLLRNKDLMQSLPTMSSLRQLRIRKQDAAVLGYVFGVPSYLDRDILFRVATQEKLPFDEVAHVAFQYADVIARSDQPVPRLGKAQDQIIIDLLRQYKES